MWGADLDAGAAKRSADLGPLEIVGRRPGRHRRRRRRQGAARLGPPDGRALRRRHGRQGQELLQRRSCCRYGYEQEAEEIQDLYLDGKKDEAAAKVPDDLLEAITLCGPEGYVAERIAAYGEAGVTHLNITPVPTGEQSVTSLVSKVKELSS